MRVTARWRRSRKSVRVMLRPELLMRRSAVGRCKLRGRVARLMHVKQLQITSASTCQSPSKPRQQRNPARPDKYPRANHRLRDYNNSTEPHPLRNNLTIDGVKKFKRADPAPTPTTPHGNPCPNRTAPRDDKKMAARLAPMLLRSAARPACRAVRPQMQLRSLTASARRPSDTLQVVRLRASHAP